MTQDNPYGNPPPPDLPPPLPGDPYGDYQVYDNPNPYGSAPTLIKVNAIINIVMAGIDLLYGLFIVLIAILFGTGKMGNEIFNGPEIGAPGPGGPPLGVIVGVMGGFAVMALLAGTLKLTAGIKLLRKSRGAWGFGLAAGIMGCTQLWCSYLCVLPMAIGIFTIVVMALQTTRNYLRDSAAAAEPQV